MANNWKSRECCTECGEYNVNCTCEDDAEFPKQITNVDVVTNIMEYSRYGAIAQMFVIDALDKWTKLVAETPIEELRAQFGPNPFMNPDAWQGVAKEIKGKLDAHLQRHGA